MYVNQLSVFIENKPGRLADITETLAMADIDLRAISVADTSDFGILRVVVDKPEVAEKALKEAGMTVSLSKVLAVSIGNRKGELSKVVRVLSDAGIIIEYVYDFTGQEDGHACIVIRVDNNEKAIKILKEHDIKLVNQDILSA